MRWFLSFMFVLCGVWSNIFAQSKKVSFMPLFHSIDVSIYHTNDIHSVQMNTVIKQYPGYLFDIYALYPNEKNNIVSHALLFDCHYSETSPVDLKCKKTKDGDEYFFDELDLIDTCFNQNIQCAIKQTNYLYSMVAIGSLDLESTYKQISDNDFTDKNKKPLVTSFFFKIFDSYVPIHKLCLIQKKNYYITLSNQEKLFICSNHKMTAYYEDTEFSSSFEKIYIKHNIK